MNNAAANRFEETVPAYDRLGVRAQILVDRQLTAARCARAAELAQYMLDARNGALVAEALDDRAAELE